MSSNTAARVKVLTTQTAGDGHILDLNGKIRFPSVILYALQTQSRNSAENYTLQARHTVIIPHYWIPHLQEVVVVAALF